MKSCFLLILFLLFSFKISAQDIGPGNLRFINTYPIYVDGGCSYFSEINIPLQERKYQIIISYQLNPLAPRIAFMQKGPHDFIYFYKTARVKTDKGYTDYYKGKKGSFTLIIDSIAKIDSWSTLRIGTLKLNVKGVNEGGILKIHGRVDEVEDIHDVSKQKKISSTYKKRPLH